MQGKIVKGIGGFYYVNTAEGLFECKAKGIFRKDRKKPLVGDDVELDILDSEKLLGNISEILPRKSELIRPAVANVEQALVIFAISKPAPNFNLLDRFLVMMERQNLNCVVCFNKLDLEEGKECGQYVRIYEECGYPVICVSAEQERNIESLKGILKGKTTTVAGPSGVGKSSIVNLLQEEIRMETGSISEKIERGRHTTRHTELMAMDENTYILDTPGFSSLDLPLDLAKEELKNCYPEFAEFEAYCKFRGCVHINEPDCGVKEALSKEKVSSLRYENYKILYEELKCRKERYGKK